MKKRTWLLLLFTLFLTFSLVLSGCSDDDDDDDITTPATLFSVTGNWNFSGSGVGMIELHLMQNTNGTISGTADRAAAPGDIDTGTVTAGANIDNVVNITIIFDATDENSTLDLTGIITEEDVMSGTYRYYDDSDQSDFEEGTWTATRQD